MLELLKRLFRKKSHLHEELQAPDSDVQDSSVSAWAERLGLAYSGPTPSRRFSVEGRIDGMPWRMDMGQPSWRFIQDEELRARADLGLPQEIAILILSRSLKQVLDKQVYQQVTNSLQTRMDSALPEELRWLAMYDEVAWPGLPETFWERFAVLSNRQDHARAWLSVPLVELLLVLREARRKDKTPFVLMLLKGRVQLFRGCKAESLPVIRQAAKLLSEACHSAQQFHR